MLDYRKYHKYSNMLLDIFVPTYSDFEKVELDKFVGYKIVEKINLNYYSIVSGMFRYQTGKIEYHSYSELYRKSEYFNNHLFNRISVFKNKKDAIEALINTKQYIKSWSGGNNDLALMKITISGNIEKAKYSNVDVTDKEVYLGESINSLKEICII